MIPFQINSLQYEVDFVHSLSHRAHYFFITKINKIKLSREKLLDLYSWNDTDIT
jgi:hypothetical protein